VPTVHPMVGVTVPALLDGGGGASEGRAVMTEDEPPRSRLALVSRMLRRRDLLELLVYDSSAVWYDSRGELLLLLLLLSRDVGTSGIAAMAARAGAALDDAPVDASSSSQ
jgi:hypothetical protein